MLASVLGPHVVWKPADPQRLFGSVERRGRCCSPPQADRIWLWVYYKQIPIYPIFYLLKGSINLSSKPHILST